MVQGSASVHSSAVIHSHVVWTDKAFAAFYTDCAIADAFSSNCRCAS